MYTMKGGKRLCIPKLPRLSVSLNPEIPNDISWISKNDHHPDSLPLPPISCSRVKSIFMINSFKALSCYIPNLVECVKYICTISLTQQSL